MLLLAATLAFAGDFPVVIRVELVKGTPGPVVATVTTAGKSVAIPLLDDGKDPDAAADDGKFTGKGYPTATSGTVTLTVGGRTVGPATVSFDGDGMAHDVDLVLAHGTLSTSTSRPSEAPAHTPDAIGVNAGADGKPPPPPLGDGVTPTGGPAEAGNKPGEGGVPVDGEAKPPPPPLGDGVTPEGGAPKDAPPTDAASPGLTLNGPGGGAPANTGITGGSAAGGLIMLAFGLGLFGVLAAVWWWLRKQEAGRLPPGVTRVPEAGLVDPRLPSLSAGLVAWVAEGDAAGILPHLARHLTDDHQLVLATTGEVPRVGGGRVHHLPTLKATQVGDAAEALADAAGGRVAVLIVFDKPADKVLRDYRDLLPTDVGGVALLPADAELPIPKVVVRVAGDGWSLAHAEHEVRVVAGARGLDVLA